LAEHGILYRTPSRPVPIYMYYPAAQILQRIAELAPDMDYSAQLQLVNELLVRRKAP
jgi:hypothetical protein